MVSRRFVIPIFADGPGAVRLHVSGREVEVPRGELAIVTGTEDLSLERSGREAMVRSESAVEIIGPSPVVVEEDLDAFVRRVAATRHRLTFAALVAARHVADIRSERASELAWRLWCAALAEKPLPGAPKALVEIVDTIYDGREGGIDRLLGKIVLGTAIKGPPRQLVLAALGASVGLSNSGGGPEDEFARRIAERIGRHPTDEKIWLSMVATALDCLDEHSPAAVRLLATALGFSVARPVPAPKPPRPIHPPPADPPAVYETPFQNTTLRIIETAGGDPKRFRVEIGGERRRVAVRKVVMDIGNPKPESDDWLEDDDAELPCLVRCLESNATTRTEKNGQLDLTLSIEGPGDGELERWVALVSVDDAGVVEVSMMHGYWACDPNVGW